MKIRFITTYIICSLFIIGCTKTKGVSPAPDTPEMAEARSAIESTNAALTVNTWKIASCVEHGVDLTYKYAAYEFHFATNGTLSAIDGNTRLTGKWVSSYIDEKIRIHFIFQNDPSFTSVDGNWTITENNVQTIRMLDAVDQVDALSLTKK